jgi:RNA-binding protein
MYRAGEVVRTAQGLAVLRVPEDAVTVPEAGWQGRYPDPPVDAGTDLVDDSLDAVGRVVDVFGPVARPYLAVDVGDRGPAELLGRRLYVQG